MFKVERAPGCATILKPSRLLGRLGGKLNDVVGVIGFLFPLALRPVGLVSGRAHF